MTTNGESPAAFVVDVDAYNALMLELSTSATRRDDERQDAKRLRLLEKCQAGLCQEKQLRQTAESVSNTLEALTQSAPNAQQMLNEVRGQLQLSRIADAPYTRLPVPVLLLGKPGIGKSMIARLIPKLLGLDSESLRLGGIQEPFALTGLDLGYGTGKEGLLAEMLSRNKTANWMLLLDELDKGISRGGDRVPAYEPLLQLLERETATAVHDVALGVDLSFKWLGGVVATVNDIDVLPAPLRDRFVVYEIPRPTREQMPVITRSIWKSLCHDEGWSLVLDDELDDAIVEKLSACPPRRAQLALLQAATRRGARLTEAPKGGERYRIELQDFDGVELGERATRSIGFHAQF